MEFLFLRLLFRDLLLASRLLCSLRARGAARHAHNDGTRGNGLHDDGVRTDLSAGTNGEGAEDLCARAYHDAFFQRRMSLRSLGEGRSAQRHTVVDRAVVAHFRRLADHDAHAVVDEDAAADLGARMNFNAGKEAPDVGHPAGEALPSLKQTPVRRTMDHHRMKPRIGKDDFKRAVRSRILFPDGFNKFPSVTDNRH